MNDAELAEARTERDRVAAIIKDAQSELGKQILGISAAVFAFSVSFVANFWKDKNPAHPKLLPFAWLYLLVAIAAVFTSIRFSAASHKLYWQELDAKIGNKPVPKKNEWRDKCIPILNNIAVCALFISIVSLGIFVLKNMGGL